MFYTPEQKDLTQSEIDTITERLWKEANDSAGKCHDCGAEPGQRHKEGCDVAKCTLCGWQRISCDCKKGKPDIWTGLWAGVKECYEQKLICYDTAMNLNKWCFDLNTWYAKKGNK